MISRPPVLERGWRIYYKGSNRPTQRRHMTQQLPCPVHRGPYRRDHTASHPRSCVFPLAGRRAAAQQAPSFRRPMGYLQGKRRGGPQSSVSTTADGVVCFEPAAGLKAGARRHFVPSGGCNRHLLHVGHCREHPFNQLLSSTSEVWFEVGGE